MDAGKEEDLVWREFDILERELGGDVDFFRRTGKHRPSQGWRRAYCRVVSAYFEALTSWMSRYAILNYHPGILGDEERQTLEARLTALERAYNALDLFTNAAGAASPLQRQSHEWTLIAQMIKIRNRLVHPKRANDVLVTDDELIIIECASKTVVHLFSESLRRSANAMHNKAEQITKHSKAL